MQIRNLIFAITIFAITGCHNENILTEDDYFISISKAELVAERIAGSLPDSIMSTNGLTIHFNGTNTENVPQIKVTHTITDNDGKPAFYIVNFERGGFVVLSADIRMGPILSISEMGYFDIIDEYPRGLNHWMSNIKESVETLRSGNYEVDESQKMAWETLLNSKQDEITTRRARKDPLEYLKITELNHIMHLKWNHHGDGYNDSVPHNCPNNPGGKAYVGCVPVTVGQILRHWQYPKSYEWDKMPTSYATPTTAKFLVDIGKDVQVYYTCNSGSGSYMDIGHALRTFYGYNATNSRYTYEALRENINSFRPVVLNGPATLHEGNRINHAWICEGYLEYTIGINSKYTITEESELQPRKMLYMNWGWHEYNGWYSSERFINGVGRFFIERMVTDIYPRDT